MEIKDIIRDGVEYPSADYLTEMKSDSFYDYVNSSYAVGLLNYLDNISAFMIARYVVNENESSDLSDDDESLTDYFKNIEELNDISEQEWTHTRLGDYCDDNVIVNGESYNNYYSIWLDQDVSDCCITKISKKHYKDMNEFNDAICRYFENEIKYKIKPIRKPDGAIRW